MKEQVGVGVIGTGFARKVQIPAFAECANARIVSVASGSHANAEAAAAEFGISHFTDDWRETVARDDVDLVCITTPPNMHREMTLESIKRGKHVLCEKPMAMDAGEATEMTVAAKAAGVMALIDHELRFQPGRQRAFAMIRNGEIGKVRHAKYLFQAPHRGDPNLPWNWWSDIAQGGGALGAINSHIIDSFLWFLDTDVSSVFCQLQTQIKSRPTVSGESKPVTTDDQANMLLRFRDSNVTLDATGLVSVSMTEGPTYLNRIEFHGDRGALRIEHRGEVYIAKRDDSDWREVSMEIGTNVVGGADTGFSRGFMSFAPKIIDAIAAGRTEIEFAATFDDGLRVQKILDAARESDAAGTAIAPA